MASGALVESRRYPYLEVRFVVRGHEETVWALVDTGFDGYLAIPHSQQVVLGSADREARYQLADDAPVMLPVYFGTVEVVGLGWSLPARIMSIGSHYILGRAVIDRYRLTFDRGVRLIAQA